MEQPGPALDRTLTEDVTLDTKGTKSSKKKQEKVNTKFKVSPLSTFEYLVAGGNPNKEILLRRANANFDKILTDIVREMLQQKIASLHYDAINNYILFAPTMVITLASAIISIFGTSQIINDPQLKIWFSIVVACLQLVLSVLQSLSKQLNFGARAGFHLSAASTLKKMYQNAKHARIENRMQSMRRALVQDPDLTDGFDLGEMQPIYMNDDASDSESSTDSASKADTKKTGEHDPEDGAEEGGEDQDEDDEIKKKDAEKQNQKKLKGRLQKQSTDSLTRQFKQAVDQVDSFIPVRVANAFNVMESRIKVINESLLTSKKHSLVAWEQVLMALYFQLAETIIEWPCFPFIIPGPRKAVDHTLRNFKKAITVNSDPKHENHADLLMVILNRSEEVAKVQANIMFKRKRRSVIFGSGRQNMLQLITPKQGNAAFGINMMGDVDENEFKDATDDVESAIHSTNYGTMDYGTMA